MRVKGDQNHESFVTDHEILLHGQKVTYRAAVEETILTDDDGDLASIYSYTYLRTGTGDPIPRPVIFAFNGGPGSSSLWLHLGLFGPRRLKMPDQVNPDPRPPYGLEDNPLSLLDICDVVMIDPVNTGYARLFRENGAGRVFGTRQDTLATALFIENWLIRYGRTGSPRYLAGESYGTIRACLLLRELMGGPMTESRRLLAIPVNGVLMLGTAIAMPALKNEPPVYQHVLRLMSQAAVNHYHHPHGKPALKEFVEEAWTFAGREYLTALFAGESLTNGDRQAVCSRLAYLTGIPADWFDSNDLKIDDENFRSLLLQGQKLDVGAYDGRYTMAHTGQVSDADPVAEDPAMGKYTPVFAGTVNTELKAELGIGLDREYRAIDFAVNGQWAYDAFVSPTEALTAAMRRNEGMTAFFGSGLYDLVTPPGVVRYLASHLNLPLDRVTVREYESGHMPYIGEQSARELAKDIRAFIQKGQATAHDE